MGMDSQQTQQSSHWTVEALGKMPSFPQELEGYPSLRGTACSFSLENSMAVCICVQLRGSLDFYFRECDATCQSINIK